MPFSIENLKDVINSTIILERLIIRVFLGEHANFNNGEGIK